MEDAVRGENTAVGKSRAGGEHVGTLIERRTVAEGVVPAGATTHVDLSFLEVQQLGGAIVENLRDAEVAVVLRVIEQRCGLVGEL